MRKKILFIQPPFERLMGYSRFYTHPGLLSLAAVLEEKNHDVLIYDADYNPDGNSYDGIEMLNNYNKYVYALQDERSFVWEEVRSVINDFKPDFIGITVVTPAYLSALKVINIAKKEIKNVKIIVGGVHATLCANDFDGIADYVVKFEGEKVILDIIEGKIEKGIIEGKRITNLDSLPLPAINKLYNLQKYTKRDLSLVLSTRGCPNDCKFCNSSNLWHRKVTRKSVKRFIEEIKMIKNTYKVDDFFISDDSFTYNNKWLIEFCREIKKLNITWRCLARIDQINEIVVDMMIDAGCRNIKFGIESGSNRILKLVNKNLKVDKVIEVSEMLKNKNITWSAYFIIGFPSETEDEIIQTQNLIKQISANSISVSIFTPYPKNKLCSIKDYDYSLYSNHSPNNNFTGTIDDKRFKELVYETIHLSKKNFIEHNN